MNEKLDRIERKLDEVLALLKEIMRRDYWDDKAVDQLKATAKAWQANEPDEDSPEWTDEEIARADLHEGGRLIRRGRRP